MGNAGPVRYCIGVGAALWVAACTPQIESSTPLLETGADRLRPGLWALLNDPCATPGDAEIFDWPQCAIPVRVRPGELTFFYLAPVRAGYILSDGEPRIVQARLIERDVMAQEQSGTFGYYSFEALGEGPFASGQVRVLRCPASDEMPIEGIALEEAAEDAHCEARTGEAVREAARRSLIRRPDWRAIWIAELP